MTNRLTALTPEESAQHSSKIKKYRAQRGLSMPKAARLWGVSQFSWENWERGRTPAPDKFFHYTLNGYLSCSELPMDCPSCFNRDFRSRSTGTAYECKHCGDCASKKSLFLCGEN